jgi:hypothetical protein
MKAHLDVDDGVLHAINMAPARPSGHGPGVRYAAAVRAAAPTDA